MTDAIKRLFSPEYLIVSEPGLPARVWLLYGCLGLLFASGIILALWLLTRLWRENQSLRPGSQAWAWYELWVCTAGLGSVLGRFLGWPGWSARIWSFTLALLALAGAAAYRFRSSPVHRRVGAVLRLLALAPDPPQCETGGRRHTALFLFAGTGHLVGISMVLHLRYNLVVWYAPLFLLGLLAPQLPSVARRHRPRLAALTPLLGAYGVVLLSWLYQRLGITIIGWQGLAFPNPMLSLFYVDGIILASVAYSLLCQISLTSLVMGRRSLRWQWPVAALLGLTLVWVSIVYLAKRTHGATASDPYAYAQMGVDLAERGTFLHRFSLFQDVIPLDIAWAPLQPVGYHIPRNELGDCPSVWATGASVLIAIGYKLLGETGLYVSTPAVGAISLIATWALAHEVLHGQSRRVRHLTAAIAVALLATSTEQVDRLLVPMADASAQLFTVLTLLFTLRGARLLEDAPRRAVGSFLLAGIVFGCAYWVRHTQLVLAVPVAVAVILAGANSRVALRYRMLSLGLVAATSLLAAVPDIVYRWNVFGGPLATETTELPAMGVAHVAPMAWQTLRDLLAAGEWGYLWPLVLYGGYRLAKLKPRTFLVLSTSFAAILAVHLPYQFLRLRDLLSLFPLLSLGAGYGSVTLFGDIRLWRRQAQPSNRLGAAPLAVGVVIFVVLSLALARWAMIDRMWKPGWASFGYMRPDQRAAFDSLAELTPKEAVVGASLNAGAIMLYSQRDAIRPYDSWSVTEWETFLVAMEDLGRPVYLLDDGQLMADFIEQAGSRHRIEPIARLPIPIFYDRDRESGWLYRLVRLR